jgi:hypothetical protein
MNATGNGLTDQQVKLTMAFASGKMNADFSDLRLVDGSCTPLAHWIESYVASSSATAWVKVPSVPVGTSSIYAYYGNSSATSVSNGAATFAFFDDGGSTSGWTVTTNSNGVGTFSSTGGYLQATHPGGACCSWYSTVAQKPISPPLMSGQYVVHFKNRTDKGNQTVCGGNTFSLIGTAGLEVRLEDQLYCNVANDNTLSFAGNTVRPSTWFAPSTSAAFATFEVKPMNLTGMSSVLYKDGVMVASVSGSSAPTLTAVQISTSVNNNTHVEVVQIDDIIIRKYAQPEPTVSIGAEQSP